MKLYKLLPIAALLLASCTEDEMDRINTDHGNPPIENIDGKLMITDGIVSTGYSTVGGDYSFYTSLYTEQLFGTGNNQFKNAEMRQLSEVAGSSTFNNVWNGTYANLLNLTQIIAKCGEGGLNEGQADLLGMAQTLAAVNWATLTDMHGDIPCSEALKGAANKQPKLDKQEDIYKLVFQLLDDAIANFATAKAEGMRNVGTQDILYGGDVDKWAAAAHALKARYKLHTMVRDNAALGQALTEANAAIAGGFKGMQLTFFDGSMSAMQSWAAFQYSRDYVACSTTMQKLLTDRNDPRTNIYIFYYDESENEQDPADEDFYLPTVGIPGNEAMSTAAGAWDLSAPKWLTYNADGIAYGDQSLHIMSLSEVYFIIAEAQARQNADCKAALTNAVAAAFDDARAFASSPDAVGALEAPMSMTAADYVATLDMSNPLKEVMVQKYIAQGRDEQVETYNDLRRCKALNQEFITLTNPRNTNGGANRWPLRLPYGNSGVSANVNVREAYGDGLYIFTENIWLFGGTR